MPLFILDGDKTKGHSPGCWGPATIKGTTCLNVKINNKAPIIVGDVFSTHQGPTNCGNNPTHTPAMIPAAMSNTVFINGKKALRDSDILNCGDSMNSAGGNVFCEGGGLGPTGSTTSGTSVNFIVGKPVIESYPSIVWKRKVRFNRDSLGQIISITFLEWCNDPSSFSPVAYTPLIDESTGQVYKNYPTQGAPDLPSYANQYLRNPIPLTFFTIDYITPGITLESNGTISGIPSSDIIFSRTIRIYARNNFNSSLNSDPYSAYLTYTNVENC